MPQYGVALTRISTSQHHFISLQLHDDDDVDEDDDEGVDDEDDQDADEDDRCTVLCYFRFDICIQLINFTLAEVNRYDKVV